QQVGSEDAALHPGDGREREAAARDGITGRVDSGVTHTLEILVDGDTALRGTLDPAHVEAQIVDLGHSSGRVYNQVGGDLRHLFRASGVDDQIVAAPFDGRDGRPQAYINSETARDLDESGQWSDEISVESLQRTLVAVEHRLPGASASGDMRELEGDVGAPDKDDAAR